MLRVVGPQQDQLAHGGVPFPLDILTTEVAQLSDDDIDEDVEIVGVEQLVAVFVLLVKILSLFNYIPLHYQGFKISLGKRNNIIFFGSLLTTFEVSSFLHS